MSHDPHRTTPTGKPRARSLGIPFDGTPGAWNAITDVPGIEVGYRTLVAGDDVRTGVTAIHPRGRANPGDPCAAGWYSLNGNGEMTGTTWIEESGTLSLPVTITNTHAVGIAQEATVRWVAETSAALAELWLLPVAAETWDGILNDINGGHVTREVATAAITSARSGPIDEGSVGGGTGMNCYEFKGGTGTASRLVAHGDATYTVGALLQCNFGGRDELVIAGTPLGRALAADNPLASYPTPPGTGSVIAVIATDAPLLPGQCKALARRVPLGLARTGTTGGHFSGDIFLAFSTANEGAFGVGFPTDADAGALEHVAFMPWRTIDTLYAAVVQCVEEAVVNALVANDEMVGRNGWRSPALPRDRVVELLGAAIERS
jgi:L-aminopeptidase/D-esterase-like protein